MRIWLEPDLTPAQALEKKKELEKVKKANDEGWVAYLHKGRAVITTRKREPRELWEAVDIIACVETWETQSTTGIAIPGFRRVATVCNEKKKKQGRGFRGIVVWGRSELDMEMEVVITDNQKQFVCLQLGKKGGGTDSYYLVVTYFAPWKAPVYSYLAGGEDPFSAPTKAVLELRGKGQVWILGYFNGRTCMEQGVNIPEIGRSVWRSDEEEVWTRFTVSRKGRSRGGRRLQLEQLRRTLFARAVLDHSQRGRVEEVGISKVLMEVALVVFGDVDRKTKTWFNEECENLRKQALACSSEDSFEAFKVYRKAVRMRKRRHLQEQQHILEEELKKEPRSFWLRLRPNGTRAELDQNELAGYVKSLYYFPNTQGMPEPSGFGCLFSREDVERELGRMQNGKAADLEGLRVELLRWGGPAVSRILTQQLNEAGLPVGSEVGLPGAIAGRLAYDA
ncbi:hypothetical protein R1sor_018072 [Riccia sorocarpa]|uniref:LAGLIDADG homing endonuclease n=1 Tax=Riccia sorocarpa TaxID=122646 RepID=A0ABD3I8M6_9MARC